MDKVPPKSNNSQGEGVRSPYHDVAYEAFVEFMSLPDPDRAMFMGMEVDPITKKYHHIPTQTEFALKYGVARPTLSVWKNRPDFEKRVDSMRKQWGRDKTANVLASLYTRCIKYGMAYDVETYLAYYENWTRTQVVKHTGDVFALEDLRSIIALLPEDKQKNAYTELATIVTEAESRRSDEESEGSSASGSGDNPIAVRP